MHLINHLFDDIDSFNTDHATGISQEDQHLDIKVEALVDFMDQRCLHTKGVAIKGLTFDCNPGLRAGEPR